MLFDLSFATNYNELRNKKQKASDLNVDSENTKRIKYDYKVNDLNLLDHYKENKFQNVMDLTKSLEYIQTVL